KTYDKKMMEIYNSPPNNENSVVYIKVNYFDSYRSYKTHYMIAQKDVIIKMMDFFKVQVKRKNYYEKKAYNELISQVFRPKVNPLDYGIGVLKLICSVSDEQNLVRLNSQGDSGIILHVNIQN